MSQLTVASFNVHWGLSAVGRPFDLTAALARLDTDVIALQEVWTPDDGVDAVARAANELGYELSDFTLSDSADLWGLRFGVRKRVIPGRWGMAILHRLPVLSEVRAPLGRAPRDAARWAHILRIQLEGRPIRIGNAHLTHRFPISAIQLRRVAAAIRLEHTPITLLADANLPRLLIRIGIHLSPAVCCRTFPSRWPIVQTDHLLVSSHWTVTDADVVTGLGSDHHAVRGTLHLD